MDKEVKILLIILGATFILGKMVLYFDTDYSVSNNLFSNRYYYPMYAEKAHLGD
jgi:hypothetical protein